MLTPSMSFISFHLTELKYKMCIDILEYQINVYMVRDRANVKIYENFKLSLDMFQTCL